MRACSSLLFALVASVGAACADPEETSETEITEAHLESAPRGLTCLAKHYTGTPRQKARGWALELPGFGEVPWDDGKTKTFEQALDDADLEDTLSIPYRTGALVPVTKENDDPGRIRVDALYRATFGATEKAVAAQVVEVDFVGQKVRFHKKAAPALERVSARLKTAMQSDRSLAAFLTGELGGTFLWRTIAGTNRLSAHSFATGIDIVVAKSDYWRWQIKDGRFTYKNRIPQAIVDAFEAEGFAWGGRWYHYDTMHFEYRPELFDPECKA